MARTNLAYTHKEQQQSYQAEPIALPRPALRTVEGQGRGLRAQSQRAPWVQTLATMSAVVLVVLATVSIARVSIANATVQMMQTSEQTSAAIDEARAQGLELEVKHSLANNPTRIQDAAADRGILPTSQPSTLAALDGFAPETIEQMRAAADAAHAAELKALEDAAQ